MAKSLPDGWKIVSLHYSDPDKSARIGPRPSDAAIARADSIRVSYTPRGASSPTAYRMIHGASSRAGIGEYIVRVIRVASPV